MKLLDGLSVLVIEDHQDTLEMFEMYLEYCGAQVTINRSGEGALAYLSGQPLDAIMTDVSVHPRRAADFVREVRSRAEYKETPLIAVSGWTAPQFDPVAIGFTAFMLKPIELDDLVGTLLRVVVRRQAA